MHVFEKYMRCSVFDRYTEEQKHLLLSIRGCAQLHKEICRFAAAAGAILTADFICREYNHIVIRMSPGSGQGLLTFVLPRGTRPGSCR